MNKQRNMMFLTVFFNIFGVISGVCDESRRQTCVKPANEAYLNYCEPAETFLECVEEADCVITHNTTTIEYIMSSLHDIALCSPIKKCDEKYQIPGDISEMILIPNACQLLEDFIKCATAASDEFPLLKSFFISKITRRLRTFSHDLLCCFTDFCEEETIKYSDNKTSCSGLEIEMLCNARKNCRYNGIKDLIFNYSKMVMRDSQCCPSYDCEYNMYKAREMAFGNRLDNTIYTESSKKQFCRAVQKYKRGYEDLSCLEKKRKQEGILYASFTHSVYKCSASRISVAFYCTSLLTLISVISQ